MIAKADALEPQSQQEVTSEETTQEQRPEWLDEKFKTPEELAKAYTELQKQLGAKTKEAPAQAENSQEQTTEEEPEANPEGTPEAELAKVGIDYGALTEEFETSGTLSDESYKALADKAGLPREYVDSYIAGQAALVREAQTRAFDIAGGEAQYKDMVNWASGNLTPAEVKAYDQAIEGTPEQVALAVAGLKSKFVAANGSEPNLVSGESNSSTGAQGFASRAEMTTAMRDPRYAKDAAYRKSVEQKISVSTIF
ncbi:hypothetical protein A7981_05655 [Methylovorus sp. MM2]|nr:hypothetical protein A7981_05655 [Methylovorus sp. MM2]